MEWRDEGVLLGTQPYGEKNLFAWIWTLKRGLVRGFLPARTPTGRRQIGTHHMVSWKARLESQMGWWTLDPLPSPSIYHCFNQPASLVRLQKMCCLLQRVLPEHHPYPSLFQNFLSWLHALPSDRSDYIHALFQLKLLEVLGYGLDLSQCAVTGTTEKLSHVSPNSGRAVCAAVAAPYGDKLLPLPSFLKNHPSHKDGLPPVQEITAALKLTDFFIHRHFPSP